MTAVLYAIPASHTCAAVERALQLKRIPYRRSELIPVVHRLPLRARFGASTVPAIAFADGGRVAGSRAIVRALEQRATAPLLAWMSQRVNGADDASVRADLIGLRTHLGRVDGWIADGTLGGAEPSAADLQIGASLRLLMTVADARPLLEHRPAGELARRWFPSYPGATPAGTLPRAWLPG